MKKIILLLTTLGFSAFSFAQVGIKTQDPYPSSDLDLGSRNKALLLNKVATTSVVNDPVDGMMVYDMSEECVKAHQDGKWTKCLGKGLNGKMALKNSLSLSCSSATVSSNPEAGKSFKGTLTIPYTNGNGEAYEAQFIQTHGLTASLAAGKFTVGNGNLVYSVTGTPDQTGNIRFNVNIGGNSCSIVPK